MAKAKKAARKAPKKKKAAAKKPARRSSANSVRAYRTPITVRTHAKPGTPWHPVRITTCRHQQACGHGEKNAGPKAGSKSSKEKVCCQETGNDKTGRKTRRTGYAGGGSGRAASDRHPGRLAVPHGGQALATATLRLTVSGDPAARRRREALARVRAVTIQEPTHGRNNRNRYVASQHTDWRSVLGGYRPGTQAIQRDACRDGPPEGQQLAISGLIQVKGAGVRRC